MNINEEIEEDSVLFDIVDTVELGNEEPESGNSIEELDFDKSELDDFDEMVVTPQPQNYDFWYFYARAIYIRTDYNEALNAFLNAVELI